MLRLLAFVTIFGALPVPSAILVKGFVDGEPVPVFVRAVPGQTFRGGALYLREDVVEPWVAMATAAARDGVELHINYGYRDYAEQRRLRRASWRLAAKPGFSTHELGISVDLNGCSRHSHRTRTYWWLVKHARTYGFFNDVTREAWHWTYLPPHADPISARG